MGIRINKCMGFLYVADSALDLKFLDGLTLFSLKSAATSKEEELKLLIDLYGVDENLALKDLISDVPTLDEDENDKYYYLFTPPSFLDKWSRYNDSLDYYESDGVAERKVQYLKGRIFPYHEKIIVATTHQGLNEKLEAWCNMDNIKSLTGVTPEFLQEFKDIGLDPEQPLAEQVYMQAPLVLQLTAKCLGINALSLRPVILTYWS